jgi:Tol biopolymer transport system component
VPARIAELSTTMGETTPEMSLDGLTIFFASNRLGNVDIFTSTRASRTSAWSAPVVVPELSSPADDAAGGISADGLEILLASIRTGDYQIYASTRPDRMSAWSAPVVLPTVSSPFQDESAFFADDLTMYLDADRQGTGDFDIFVAHRPFRGAPFGEPQRVDSIDTPMRDHDPWVSPDGRHMFFMSDRANGVLLLYEAAR